ncbi:MAG: GNAT family N-acetyltransferase [Polyangiales bacterium]
MIELSPSDYAVAETSLQRVPINTLFVQSVLRRHVEGRVFADDATDPQAFYSVHPYGMALLWGSSNRPTFRAWVRERLLDAAKERVAHEWLQVHPDSWAATVEAWLGDRLVKCTRVNFAFRRDLYLRERTVVNDGAVIVRTDEAMFSRIEGSVAPSHFWPNASEFVRAGGGCSLLVDGDIAATAFCSFRHGAQLEIGIETAEPYRGRGYARRVAIALIDHCIEHGLEPVWSCRLENTASFQLAKKLAFEPTVYLPYYPLPFGGA